MENTKNHKLNVEGFLPVYKALPPFMKYDGGFGYKGVLLEDEETGKLQCHICGELADNIPKHLHHKHKGISQFKYKELTGLNKYTPLLSTQLRKKIKNNFLNLTPEKKDALLARLKKNAENAHKSGNWKKREKKGETQYENRFGTCPEQAKERFWIEYKKFGRIPSIGEMSRGLAHLVYSRFGNYKTALLAWGVSENEYRERVSEGKLNAIRAREENNFFPKYTADDVKKQYQDFYFQHKRLPTWGEVKQYGLPSRVVFERVFGKNKSDVMNSFRLREHDLLGVTKR